MITASSIRRLSENEVVFRTYNENVESKIEEMKDVAAEEDQTLPVSPDDMPLLFYCECSDEDCHKRISLLPKKYSDIHKARNRFIVLRDHEVKEIERIVRSEKDYHVVEKFVDVPKHATSLNNTDLHNS